MSITIADLLRGCTPEQIQSVGYMQVIPLTSDMVDDRIVSPSKAASVNTCDYGTLEFKNKTDKVMVVPSHAAYMVKQAAQDHALPHAGIVGKKKKVTFSTARCIQETQGGLISSGEHQMAILPFPLRQSAHQKRNEHNYSALWSSIRQLKKDAGITGSGNLIEFMGYFKKELDQFVAEFEPVKNQVGAIILIGGKVVGIERAPNHEYWLEIWPALIRDCYGSLAILEAKQNKGKEPPVPKTRSKLGDISQLSDLVGAVDEAEKNEYENVKAVFENVSDIKMKQKSESTSAGLDIDTLEHKRFIGQIVRDDEQVLYGSLIATDKWRNNEDWFVAKKFSM